MKKRTTYQFSSSSQTHKGREIVTNNPKGEGVPQVRLWSTPQRNPRSSTPLFPEKRGVGVKGGEREEETQQGREHGSRKAGWSSNIHMGLGERKAKAKHVGFLGPCLRLCMCYSAFHHHDKIRDITT
jgi:hypothetical protein